MENYWNFYEINYKRKKMLWKMRQAQKLWKFTYMRPYKSPLSKVHQENDGRFRSCCVRVPNSFCVNYFQAHFNHLGHHDECGAVNRTVHVNISSHPGENV